MYAGKEHKMDFHCFRDTCNKITIRNDKYFRNHWKTSIKCSEIGITINYEDPLQSLRSNNLYDPKLFCQELKEKSINNIIKEFDRRFSKGNIQLLSSLDSLDASKQAYLDFDAITYIAEHFKNCITFDFMLLKNESERAKIVLKDGYPLDLDFYPQLKKLIMISQTIPVSTATVERSFSAMN